MTKIRLLLNVAVDTKDHAQTIFDWLKTHLDWFGPIAEDETYFITFHLCEHDEVDLHPCRILEEWRNGKITWHNGEPVP